MLKSVVHCDFDDLAVIFMVLSTLILLISAKDGATMTDSIFFDDKVKITFLYCDKMKRVSGTIVYLAKR